MKILDRQILYQQGTYRRERIWIEGWHLELSCLAVVIFGLSGRETVLERDVVLAVHLTSTSKAKVARR